MADSDASTPKQGGRWKPGESGNPAGAKPGRRQRVTVLAERIIEEDAEDVVRSVVAAAKGGDMVAAGLLLKLIIPARKGRPIVMPLPAITAAADVPKAMAAVCEAVAEGDISPEEGAAVAGIVEASRRAIETAELESRIAALEASNGQ